MIRAGKLRSMVMKFLFAIILVPFFLVEKTNFGDFSKYDFRVLKVRILHEGKRWGGADGIMPKEEPGDCEVLRIHSVRVSTR